jgi:hypothetical protein
MKLWQLILGIVVVAVALALVPNQSVAALALLGIEAVLLVSLAVLAAVSFAKRWRKR